MFHRAWLAALAAGWQVDRRQSACCRPTSIVGEQENVHDPKTKRSTAGVLDLEMLEKAVGSADVIWAAW
jgi:hypothetical protein